MIHKNCPAWFAALNAARDSGIPVIVLLAVAITTGCRHLGPQTVEMDRFDYSTTIAESWKQQTLLNIVKLRYMDLPVFVDVASIVAGYSLETGVSMGGSWPETTSFGGNTATLGGSAKFIDRPTITYVPLTGEKFLRGLITPIDPKNIFSMIQSGYAADFILGLTVESLNGLRNRSSAGGAVREADPDFIRVLELIRDLQAAGAFGLTVEEDKELGETGVIFFRHDGVLAEVQEKGDEIRRLLNLPMKQQRFTLTYSPVPGREEELAVNSRSMLQILSAFSTYLDVPEEDVIAHHVAPTLINNSLQMHNAVRIHSGKDKPDNTFAAVKYRSNWFWVENSDWQTKRALTTIVFLFTLSDTGGSDKLPLITIPAQ